MDIKIMDELSGAEIIGLLRKIWDDGEGSNSTFPDEPEKSEDHEKASQKVIEELCDELDCNKWKYKKQSNMVELSR